jgi:hypothetical protein
MQYLTVKIMELKTNNKNIQCLFRSANRMKNQPSNNSVKDNKGDVLADPYSTFHR